MKKVIGSFAMLAVIPFCSFAHGKQDGKQDNNAVNHSYYETRIKHIKDLPFAVRTGFENSKYGSCYVRNIHEMKMDSQPVIAIVVSQVINYQMGALYKDVYRLVFSLDGKLIKTETVS